MLWLKFTVRAILFPIIIIIIIIIIIMRELLWENY